MSLSALVLFATLAHAAPPDRGESGLGVDEVPVRISRRARVDRPVLAGLRLLRGLGKVGTRTPAPVTDGGERADGIPPTGPAPLSR